MNIIVALMVNQMSNVQAEIILAKQRIQEITALTASVWFRKNQASNNVENGQDETDTLQKIVCISSSPANKWYCPGFYDMLSLDDFYQKVRSGKKWEICSHKDSSYCEPCKIYSKYQIPEHLIKLTLSQLEEKRKDRIELMDHVKTVQKEIIGNLYILEAKEQKSLGTYDVSEQTVKIPAGHELEGLILKTQDGKKVIITI